MLNEFLRLQLIDLTSIFLDYLVGPNENHPEGNAQFNYEFTQQITLN